MRERTIEINGFSKAYAMTGWRMGYVAAPHEICEQMHKIHQYCIMCAPTTSQFAAIEALRNGDPDIAEMTAEYNRRRRLIVDGLRKIGLSCFEPEGAFYVYPNISSVSAYYVKRRSLSFRVRLSVSAARALREFPTLIQLSILIQHLKRWKSL